MNRLLTVVAGICVAAASTAAAPAPVTLIYPAPPGGGGDVYFRILAKVMEMQGNPMVVVNAPGGGGAIGMEKMVNSKPDGQTVAGVWTAPVSVTPHTLGTRYKTSDYVPVIRFSSTPYTLCTRPDFPASNGRELIELAKQNPNKYTYGTDGPGGLAQLAATRIFQAFGTSQRDIPYKGAGETTMALMGKSIDIYVGSIPPILPFLKSGAAKCLIVSSPARASVIPTTDALGDLGIPGEETLLWRGVLAPKGTPAEQVERLARMFEQAAQAPEALKFLQDNGETLQIIKTGAFGAVLEKEYADFARVIKAAGMDKKN